MAEISIEKLVEDAKCYLPDSSVLSDAALTNLAENVVEYQIPENDNVYYSEALCKLLKSAGFVNKLKASGGSSGAKKKEKAGDVEVEFYEGGGTASSWDDYIDSLVDVCPLLPGGGYNLPSGIGILINSGGPIVINDCDTEVPYL